MKRAPQRHGQCEPGRRARDWLLRGAAAGVLTLAATGCRGGGGPEEATLLCVGEEIAVGDSQVRLVGKGRSASDSYGVANILFEGPDGERITLSNYSGAMASLPASATNGWAPWHGYKIQSVENDVRPPGDRLGPCIRVVVSELPPGWEPPEDAPASGH